MHPLSILALLFILRHGEGGENTEGECTAARITCKQAWVSNKPERVVIRWLNKLKRDPDCLLTPHSEGDKVIPRIPLGEGKVGGKGCALWKGNVDNMNRYQGLGIMELNDCSGQDVVGWSAGCTRLVVLGCS